MKDFTGETSDLQSWMVTIRRHIHENPEGLLLEMDLPGRIRILFQPAEESGRGADKMIREGAVKDLVAIFGGHIDTHYETGVITVDEGIICACETLLLSVWKVVADMLPGLMSVNIPLLQQQASLLHCSLWCQEKLILIIRPY